MTAAGKMETASWSNSIVLPNAGTARFLKFIAAVFLVVGLLALTERVWTLSSDVYAQKTWPIAAGEIVSATQRDDSSLSTKAGSVTSRTRYWVEYEVSLGIPVERCRTGMIYEGPGQSMPCHGIVRTRSTQSSSQAFQWLLDGYHENQRVNVLWDPSGTRSTDVKILGQPIWMRYNFGRLFLSSLWVFGSALGYAFCHRQLRYFAKHPEDQNLDQPSTLQVKSEDDDQLTKLDLT